MLNMETHEDFKTPSEKECREYPNSKDEREVDDMEGNDYKIEPKIFTAAVEIWNHKFKI